MQIHVTLEGTNFKQHARSLNALASILGQSEEIGTTTPMTNEEEPAEEKSHIDMGEMKAKRTRKSAAPKEEEKDADDEIDLGETESDDIGKETLTLDDHIIPAFQAYAKKHSREAAGKILGKFKVKSVRELPEAKFEEILKILGVR